MQGSTVCEKNITILLAKRSKVVQAVFEDNEATCFGDN